MSDTDHDADKPQARSSFDELKDRYDGPPPIPLEELEKRYPAKLGFRCSHGWYFSPAGLTPIAIVEFPDGSIIEFHPGRTR